MRSHRKSKEVAKSNTRTTIPKNASTRILTSAEFVDPLKRNKLVFAMTLAWGANQFNFLQAKNLGIGSKSVCIWTRGLFGESWRVFGRNVMVFRWSGGGSKGLRIFLQRVGTNSDRNSPMGFQRTSPSITKGSYVFTLTKWKISVNPKRFSY